MVPGSCPRKYAPQHFHLDITIQILLGTPSNKRSYTQPFMIFIPPSWSQLPQTCKPPKKPLKNMRITMLHTVSATGFNRIPFQLCSFAIWSAFVGTSISVGTRQSKISCLGLSSRVPFKTVWVTQGLPYILPRVALDKTCSTSGRKFKIGRLTSSPIHPYQFDTDGAPEESDLLRFFWGELEPSVKAQIE